MKKFMKKITALVAAAMMILTVSAVSLAATPRPYSEKGTSTSDSASKDSDSSKSSSSKDSDSSDEASSKSSSSKDSDSSDSGSSKSSSSQDSDSSDSGSSKSTASPQEGSTKDSAKKETQAPAPTQAPNNQSAPAVNKSYTTKGGAFLWFLLSIIINTIISFAIANRFYKLSRKSNHVQSEIRALRRDIEEKFADSVGGFSEPAVDITNTNDDYSNGVDGIKMTPASSVSADSGPEDVYKEWEAQFASKRARIRSEVKAVSEDSLYDGDIKEDNVPRPSKKKYQPSRKSKNDRMSVRERIEERRAQSADDEYGADDDEPDSGISDKIGSVGSKAKKFLGGIFPMGDDDE